MSLAAASRTPVSVPASAEVWAQAGVEDAASASAPLLKHAVELSGGLRVVAAPADPLEAGRAVEIDHFGALFYYCLDQDPAAARALADPFIPRGRVDDATLARCTAFGPPARVREHLEAYAAGGASKFILRPMCPPERMLDQLDQLAAEVVPAFHRRTG